MCICQVVGRIECSWRRKLVAVAVYVASFSHIMIKWRQGQLLNREVRQVVIELHQSGKSVEGK